MTITVKELEDFTGVDYEVRDSSLTDDVVKAQIRQMGRIINTEAGKDMSTYRVFNQIALEGSAILLHNLMVEKKIISGTRRSMYSPNIFTPLKKYMHSVVIVKQNF